MENILNFVQEESEKYDAETKRRAAENQIQQEKRRVYINQLVEKLKPLEKLYINDHACNLVIPNGHMGFMDHETIRIEYGKPWKPAFESYEARHSFRINIKFTKDGIVLDAEFDFSWHVTNNTKNLPEEEVLKLVAKHLAPYKGIVKE